jgi:hypothetical protein
MKPWQRVVLKAAAVASSVALVAGFVAYRAGAFDRLLDPEPPPPPAPQAGATPESPAPPPPAFVLGFPLATLAGFIAFRGVWAIFIHSNVRLPVGPLRYVIGAPQLHHWHHDRARDAGNYANLSPLIDLLFGTYRCPDHEPAAFGVTGAQPRTYLGHMLRPLSRPARGPRRPPGSKNPSGSGDGGRL